MELAGESACPLSPAAIIGWTVPVQEGEWRFDQAGRCQRMESTDPACRQADSCRLRFFVGVQVQIPQEFPLVEKAQYQPGFACARIAESAIKFRSADRQLLEQ